MISQHTHLQFQPIPSPKLLAIMSPYLCSMIPCMWISVVLKKGSNTSYYLGILSATLYIPLRRYLSVSYHIDVIVTPVYLTQSTSLACEYPLLAMWNAKARAQKTHAVICFWIPVNLGKVPERKLGTHRLNICECGYSHVLSTSYGDRMVSHVLFIADYFQCWYPLRQGLKESKYYWFCLFSKIKVHGCKHLLESIRSSDTLNFKESQNIPYKLFEKKITQQ